MVAESATGDDSGKPRESLRRALLRRWLPLALLTLVAWAAAGATNVALAARDLQQARDYAELGQSLVLDRELSRARFELDHAGDAFISGRRRLTGLAAAPLRVLPVIGPNLRVLGDLAGAGGAAAQAGEEISEAIAELEGGADALAPRDGALPVAAFEELAKPVERAAALLARSRRLLERTYEVPVVARVAEARTELAAKVEPAARGAQRAGDLLPVLPRLLGAGAPRRYLIVPQNPAESRGTGGFIGAYAVATLRDGRFSFGRVGSIDELPVYPANEVVPPNPDFADRYNRYGGAGFWKNINLTPDFPSAARAMETLFVKGTGTRLDGVIAADPYALEAMIEVAGPVEIRQFGEVDAGEIVKVVTNEAYNKITSGTRRKKLLGEIFVGAFEGFLRSGGGGGDPLRTAQVLGKAVNGGHLLMHSTDAEAQAALLQAGIAGQLRDADGDFVAVITNAGTAAKVDYYLDRAVAYYAKLEPGGSLQGDIDATFKNNAPTSGVAKYVIGPNVRGLEAGENHLIVSAFGPPTARLRDFGRSLGEQPLRTETELDHRVFTTVMTLESGQSERVFVSWSNPRGWEELPRGGGRYVLTLQRQTVLRPVETTVVVDLPPGMRVLAASPLLVEVAPGRLTYEGVPGPLERLEVRFAPGGG